MPNPNPKLANLTRAGRGQPKKNLTQISVALTPELLDKLNEICARNGWKRNHLIEQILRASVNYPPPS
jgi:hypothetical protein